MTTTNTALRTGWRTIRDLLLPDPVADFWAEELGWLSRRQAVVARVTAVTPEGRDAVTIRLQPNARFQEWLPGQHITVGVDLEGRRWQRSYTPRFAPSREGASGGASRELLITVKREPQGRVSSWLCTRLKVGDVLHLSQPWGTLTLDTLLNPADLSGRPDLLLLAGGSGITPMVALMQALLRGPETRRPARVTLLYWSSAQPGEFLLESELRQLAAAWSGFQMHCLSTRRPQDGAVKGGRASLAQVESLVPELGDCVAFACGPQGLVETLQGLLADRVNRFECETFSAPSRSPATGTDSGGQVNLTLKRSGRQLRVSRDTSLLEALEAQGVSPAHGCRIGVCNTCVCRQEQGSSEDFRRQERSTEPASLIRLCSSRPVTDLTLDL